MACDHATLNYPAANDTRLRSVLVYVEMKAISAFPAYAPRSHSRCHAVSEPVLTSGGLSDAVVF